MGPLPIDPSVKKGVLDNGLTYYIRANAEPQGQAEFFIVQKVGSIQEEDNQQGLAHFLEHMAFNGLRNFPKKDLFKFTEGIGVKFGYNLNAYTSFDRTVYNISAVPVSREGIIDSCILVLYDWADGLLLTPEDISDERGVIREEMRTSDNAFLRMYKKIGPEIMPNNKYNNRYPIGTEEVVMNFKPEDLRDYYEKWYRPDHQGIIIVGDFDADKVEQKVKDLFSKIEKPTTPSELVPVTVDTNGSMLVGIATDPEATTTSVSIEYKHDLLPAEIELSAQGLIMGYLNNLVFAMFSSRFQEIIQAPNAPFTFARVSDGHFFLTNTMGSFSADASAKEGGSMVAYKALLTELARVKQHGFTASEYERAKADYMSDLEKQYKERNKQKSYNYAQEYVRNFLDNEPIPGIETEYALITQVSAALPIENVNEYVKQYIQDENIVVSIIGPQKDGVTYPTKDEVIATYNEIMSSDVEAYKEEVSNEPLIAKLPKKGKISKTEKNSLYDATVYTLSNGIKVVVKTTDFKDDEILFSAASFGGSSLFDVKDISTIKVINDIATIGGLGNFNKVALNKALAGKKASVRSSVGLTTENLSGSATVKDLETMMQLIYLTATAPRYDEEAFTSWKERTTAQLEQQLVNPMYTFIDTLQSNLYNNNPRVKFLTVDDVNKVDYKKAIALYNDRFKDMNDFTFFFVGNIDNKVLLPLLEQYIATLPAAKRKETWKDPQMNAMKGVKNNTFDKQMETPKTTVGVVFNGEDKYSPLNSLKYDVFGDILDMVYTEEIREKEGGTYGVSVNAGLERSPKESYSLLIYFDTDKEKYEKLLPIVYRELQTMTEEDGIDEDKFDKVIEYLLKEEKSSKRENRAWMNAMSEFFMYGTDSFTTKEANIKSITTKDVQTVVAKILKDNNKLEIIMNGFAK
ncbi:zinc protease [Bacteroidia bacterium]|nr:zinc protease [Bacteroidia bacterium]